MLATVVWGSPTSKTHQAPNLVIPEITATVEIPKPRVPAKDLGPFSGGTPPKPIVFDNATAAKLKALANAYQKVAHDNYGLILNTLHLPLDRPSKPVKIVVTYSYNGVAATTGAGFGAGPTTPVIEVSAKYALAHPNDMGMIVHEMTHVVQSYPSYNPVWLVEGIADYVRWFFYEPVGKRPRPNPAKATARDSYQTTGAFLYWASCHYDLNLVPKLSKAFQADAYKESLFKEFTGRTLDQLNEEWVSSLRNGTTKI